MMNVQAVAAVESGEEVTVASIHDQPGTIFLYGSVVYMTQQTVRTGGGYVTVTDLATGQDQDVPTGASVLVSQNANLVAAF